MLGEYVARGRYVVNQLVKAGAFYLLALHVGDRVHEVKHNTALLQLPDEQSLLLSRLCVCDRDTITGIHQEHNEIHLYHNEKSY